MIDPVYGLDDRQDLYQVTDPLYLRLADATVAMVSKPKLVLDASKAFYAIKGSTLRQRHNVCPTERFVDQTALASCSGALVGPDLVLTAGHCIEDQADCESNRFVFGFSIREEGGRTESLPVNEVYQCSKIVGRSFLSDKSDAPDFAVIQLDRPVVGHSPVGIERRSQLNVGTPLLVVGHPSGIPAKVAGGANVRENSDAVRFVANLDTYHGNSGSPVFNARTGLIEGILVSGETDYSYDSANRCNRDKLCKDDGCRGEKSVRVSFAASYIPEL